MILVAGASFCLLLDHAFSFVLVFIISNVLFSDLGVSSSAMLPRNRDSFPSARKYELACSVSGPKTKESNRANTADNALSPTQPKKCQKTVHRWYALLVDTFGVY